MATTIRENKELVRRFISEANDQNYDQVTELFTADYTRHDPDAGVDAQGPEPFIEALQRLHEAFPDSEVHIGELIAENDIVAFEGTMTGTHEGPFKGIEPTHERIEIPGNAMHRVRDGQIVETWATWNFLAGLQQLGAIDEPVE
ncbi:ester cyclase [Halopenitus persicus]|uniref:ester cyclase n=1 Tax=Halopenitus persicus TaxID=1048396 RepID=UPI000BBA9627|nr:ester cyclase [Halopenitus persicus]